MMKIELGKELADHPIPDTAFDEDAVILAKKGAGKTVLAKGIVERSLSKGERTLVIDPKGDWWGLKAAADGKGDGYPVAIFGGRHGDMPFTLETADALAKTLAETNLPAILDVSDMPMRARAAALTVFLKSLFKHNRNSLFLVLDEVHTLAPQNPSGAEAYALREIIAQIVTLGRQRGFRLLSVCQRVQLVDKTLVTQADTLIAMRLLHTRDRAPALDWLAGNAPELFAKTAKNDVGTLRVGEAIVGSVGAEFFERVSVPMNGTFDSSATPKRGETVKQPQTLAQVDLSSLKEALAQTNEPEPDTKSAPIPQGSITLKSHKDVVAQRCAKAYGDGKKKGEANGYNRGYAAALLDVQKQIDKMPIAQVSADVNHYSEDHALKRHGAGRDSGTGHHGPAEGSRKEPNGSPRPADVVRPFK